MDALDFRRCLERCRTDEGTGTVLIYGLGSTGFEVSQFLERERIRWLAVDDDASAVERFSARGGIRSRCTVSTELGPLPNFLERVEVVLVSPGVAPNAALLDSVRVHQIPIASDLDLATLFFDGKLVGVTGSNGKSTTVSLIHHLLLEAGIGNTLAGNIGVPPLSLLPAGVSKNASLHQEALSVWEVSSYQLEHSQNIPFWMGMILNISENHLARHKCLEEYFQVKKQIFGSSALQVAIINADDRYCADVPRELSCEVLTFGCSAENNAWIDYAPTERRDRIVVTLAGVTSEFACDRAPLLGRHNRYNIAAALLAAMRAGASARTLERGLQTFTPLRYRLEPIEHGGILFLNDSKSTTVASTVSAIEAAHESFSHRPLYVLVGGLLKGGSLAPLEYALYGVGPALGGVICFGGDGKVLAKHLRNGFPGVLCYETLREAVNALMVQVQAGSVVLFSPAGASFDEFSSFEDRGAVFQSMIEGLFQAGSS